MWTVLQTPAFQQWYDAQDADARKQMLAAVMVLAAEGPALGRPRVDTIQASKIKNLKELRVQSRGRPFRVFFVFDPRRNAVLLVGGNKAGRKRFYQEMVRLAERIYEEYLEDTKNDG